jgi:hypothetical protein
MKVFLSYPSEQEGVAREVYTFLRTFHLDVWFDKESIIAGQDWDRERAAEQKRADLTLLVCSSETLEKAGVIRREINDILDLARDKPPQHIFLISLRTDDVRLPPELARYQYVNHFDSDWRMKIARAIQHRLSQLDEPKNEPLERWLQTAQQPEIKIVRNLTHETDVLERSLEYIFYNLEGEYWNYVNANIYVQALGGYFKAKSEFRELWKTEDWTANKNSWSVSVEEFYRDDQYLSLRFFYYWYGSGAAHPNSYSRTMNFAGESEGVFSLRELFRNDVNAIQFLMKYAEMDLKRQILQYGDDTDLLWYPKTADEAWDAFSHFNFDAKGITLNFSPYSVLAYVFGHREVIITWDILTNRLTPDFFAVGPISGFQHCRRPSGAVLGDSEV